jgi:uncharacterized repeat protein (TIGR02543 family)
MSIKRKIPALLISLALTLAIIPIMATPAGATSTTVDITNSASGIHAEDAITTALATNNTVTVTGTLENNMIILLNIPAGKRIIWDASYTGSVSSFLIHINGHGVFEITDNANILNQNTDGFAIAGQGNTSVVVNGGTITNGNNFRGIQVGSNSTLIVNSGTVGSVEAWANAVVCVQGGTITTPIIRLVSGNAMGYYIGDYLTSFRTDSSNNFTVGVNLFQTATVIYNPNGGIGTRTVTPVETSTNHVVQANTFNLTGYTFLGWNTQPDGSGTSYAANDTINSVNSHIILYAQWCNHATRSSADCRICMTCGNTGLDRNCPVGSPCTFHNFGNVPNTSNHTITWAMIAMGGFAVMSAGLWIVVLRSRRKQKI